MTQDEAFSVLKMGYNVFLTGRAGSGKTYLLNNFIAHLREHGAGVAVTASTGIAATHIGGQTIHAWSGIGVRDALADDELQKLLERKQLRQNFKDTNVLIIDEISMLHARQLDMVDRIARRARDFTRPFGGLQVVLTGDFFQLPPIARDGEPRHFAFEAASWQAGEFQVCYLAEQFRQQHDPLLAVLDDIRAGTTGEHTRIPLRTRYRKEPEGGAVATKLYAHNINVDAINAAHLEKLSSKTHVFDMETRGFRALVEALKKNCLAPETLSLKEGAEVIFVKNDPQGRFVNGTRGVVEAFAKEGGFPLVRTSDDRLLEAEPMEWTLEEDGRVRALLSQVPLRLAWAITIHKSQGMTLESAEIDLSDAFEPGMGYVALSRVKKLSGLKLLGLNDIALQVNKAVLARDSTFQAWSKEVGDVLGRFSQEDQRMREEETLYDRFGVSRQKQRGEADTKTNTKRRAKGAPRKRPQKEDTYEATRVLVAKGLSLSKIARTRALAESTIISHLEELKMRGTLPDIAHLAPPAKDRTHILHALEKSGGLLKPAFEALEGTYSYTDIKLVRLYGE